MRKIKIFSIFYFLFFTLTIVTALEKKPLTKEDVQFRMIIDASSKPFFYEFQNSFYSFGIRGSFFGGVKIRNDFTVGLQLFGEYLTFDGKSQAFLLNGSWLDIRITADFLYKVKNIMELKWGLGGIFRQSAFNYDNRGWIGLPHGGLSFLFGMNIFFPIKILDLEVNNTLDLMDFLSTDKANYYFNPVYVGAVRLNIHPGLTWLSMYLEVSGMPWIYKNDYTPDFTTGLLMYSVGCKFDISASEVKNQMAEIKDKIAKKKQQNELKKKEKLKSTLAYKIDNANLGDKLALDNVRFKSKNEELLDISKNTLDKLANELKRNKELVIVVYGYSEYLGNPINEYNLYTKRAKIIKEYLEKKGANGNNIKVSAKGLVAANAKIEIEIVKK